MTDSAHTDPAAVERMYSAKARAELAAADRMLGEKIRVGGAGDPLGRVLLVKGRPGPDDTAAGRALAGADGAAAAKALEALGRDPASMWATCSRPTDADAETVARRLELIVEAVDPALVLALDREAAQDVASAMRLGELVAGVPIGVRGRVIGSVDGLEASLSAEGAKSRVWSQMKSIARALPPRSAGDETRKGRP
jgi:uracil-DNA glycosylase